MGKRKRYPDRYDESYTEWVCPIKGCNKAHKTLPTPWAPVHWISHSVGHTCVPKELSDRYDD